jgi:competence protein ComEC
LESLKLINNKKEWFYLSLLLTLILSLNISKEYSFWKEFTSNEIYQTTGKIVNIYPKENKNNLNHIAKIETEHFTFFTPIPKNILLKRTNTISLIIVSQKVTFYDFLKGFFAPSFGIEVIPVSLTAVENIYQMVLQQHHYQVIGDFYNTLFFATPLDKNVQNLCAIYGIAHVVAISGFHLSIISVVLFFILNLLYSPLHQKYFPYRNKKMDILIVITMVLFIYLVAINLVPSFLRSFVMFLFGLFLLRSNIKLFSFGSLAFIVLLIIAFFPKLFFSLSLWFSVAGVFYIFLYMQYFSTLNKYFSFLFFNFWIFFAINPITHFFFGTTALAQLLSPFITIGFIVFYPLELLLHLISFGDILDNFLELWITTEPKYTLIFTPIWLFGGHIFLSLLAIWYKFFFYLLNIIIVLFNCYIFLFAWLIYYG